MASSSESSTSTAVVDWKKEKICEEIEQTMGFKILGTIAKGKFSEITYGKCIFGVTDVCFKLVVGKNEEHEKQLENEVKILKELSKDDETRHKRHANGIIIVMDFFEKTKRWMLMELGEEKNFEDFLLTQQAKNGPIQEQGKSSQEADRVVSIPECRPIFLQLLTISQFLLQKKISHRQISPKHLIFVERGGKKVLKLIDFKDAVKQQEYDEIWKLDDLKYDDHRKDRTIYRSPEETMGVKWDRNSGDTWSIAIILCSLLYKRPVFTARDDYNLLKQIIEVCGKPSTDLIEQSKFKDIFFKVEHETRKRNHENKTMKEWRMKTEEEMMSDGFVIEAPDNTLAKFEFSPFVAEQTESPEIRDLANFNCDIKHLLEINPERRYRADTPLEVGFFLNRKLLAIEFEDTDPEYFQKCIDAMAGFSF